LHINCGEDHSILAYHDLRDLVKFAVRRALGVVCLLAASPVA
jgi:hypothetical protein